MKKYFVATDGKQKGPWSLDEIKLNISKEYLSWNDHIYDDKKDCWLFLFQQPELTDFFNSTFSNVNSNLKTKFELDVYKDRAWHIFKEDHNYGPFTTSEMIQMLQSKTLYEYDFIWKQGAFSWKRLSEVADFEPIKIKQIFESSQFEFNQSNIRPFFRRKFPRADFKANLFVHDNRKIHNAESVEIGFGGFSFVLPEVDLQLESQIHVHFKSGSDLPPFNAICKIVNKQDSKYGVAFVKIDSSIQAVIADYSKVKAG